VIYLDHHATTPVLPEVVEAMLPYLTTHFGNPSSGHAFGQAAKAAVTNARAQVAALINAHPSELVFTSGGTEANNLAIFGLSRPIGRTRVVTTSVEHPATLQTCAHLGLEVFQLPVDAQGRVHPSEIDERTALVTAIHAQNETGVLQPIAELAALAKSAGALIHTDAAQSAGKVELDVRALGVDALSIAGHKLYAPKGVGVLFIRDGVALRNITFGAGHERGLRPGTENVAGIVGLGAACVAAKRDLQQLAAQLTGLRDLLFMRLSAKVPQLRLNGHRTLHVPGALNVSFPGVSGTALLAKTPELAASTGSACHDGHDDPSPVLLAMGLSAEQARGAVRLTLGRSTTEDEIERAAAALSRAWEELKP
jgi:cysteine desulfurase